MHSLNYTPRVRKVIRGFGPERTSLLEELRDREGDLTHLVVAFSRPNAEQAAKIETCRSTIARICARLEEITIPGDQQ